MQMQHTARARSIVDMHVRGCYFVEGQLYQVDQQEDGSTYIYFNLKEQKLIPITWY